MSNFVMEQLASLIAYPKDINTAHSNLLHEQQPYETQRNEKPHDILLTNGKAWQLHQSGNVDNLALSHNLVLQTPQDHEITVRIHAVGLHSNDLLQANGIDRSNKTALTDLTDMFKVSASSPILGTEFAGQVVALGRDHAVSTLLEKNLKSDKNPFFDSRTDSAVPRFKLGERVMGITKRGAFSTFINIDPRYLLPVPQNWTDEQAAAFPTESLSSYYAFSRLAHIERGSVVLLRSAAINLQSAQILAQLDCWVLGTVNSSAKLKLLQLLHGDNPRFKFVLTEPNEAPFKAKLNRFLEYVSSHCSVPIRKFDFVVDSRGPQDPLFNASFDYLVPCGAYILLGEEAICPPPQVDLSLNVQNLFSMMRHPTKALGLVRYYFKQRVPWRALVNASSLVYTSKTIIGFHPRYFFDPDVDSRLLACLFSEISSLQLDPPYLGAAYDFQQLPEALKCVQSDNAVGKVVVRVTDPLVSSQSASSAVAQIIKSNVRQQSVDDEWVLQKQQIEIYQNVQFSANFKPMSALQKSTLSKAA